MGKVMKKFITPEIEHMIRLEVESELRKLLPLIVRPLVRKILNEKQRPKKFINWVGKLKNPQ